MDQTILQYYKRLLKNGFPHAGKMADPDIFIDSLGEKMQICGSIARAYSHIFIKISDNLIYRVQYLCVCDPTANVVFETLCDLVEKKPLNTYLSLTERDFSNWLGCHDETFLTRSKTALNLLGSGIQKYDPLF